MINPNKKTTKIKKKTPRTLNGEECGNRFFKQQLLLLLLFKYAMTACSEKISVYYSSIPAPCNQQ